jgi:hypothetical protein
MDGVTSPEPASLRISGKNIVSGTEATSDNDALNLANVDGGTSLGVIQISFQGLLH